jgi:hypothetical protein
MKSFYIQMIQSPGLFSIMEDEQFSMFPPKISDDNLMKHSKWRRNIFIRVDITDKEVNECYNLAMKNSETDFIDRNFLHYKIYLHLFSFKTPILLGKK